MVVVLQELTPEWKSGLRSLNPDDAGKLRFNQPRTVALLKVDEHGMRPRFVGL